MPAPWVLWNILAHNPQALLLWFTNSHVNHMMCSLYGFCGSP